MENDHKNEMHEQMEVKLKSFGKVIMCGFEQRKGLY